MCDAEEWMDDMESAPEGPNTSYDEFIVDDEDADDNNEEYFDSPDEDPDASNDELDLEEAQDLVEEIEAPGENAIEGGGDAKDDPYRNGLLENLSTVISWRSRNYPSENVPWKITNFIGLQQFSEDYFDHGKLFADPKRNLPNSH
eukprot:CAMPEP_0185747156 /NCGR_PEP_ID=MMETSP1174-20130828/5794_1 /TAXON_ID=35687 /ORGANISM="Dictyocha speculum, Strain CCMP1381" /LENGTH=144 /DNA_ID=CAMNT_0028422211 /DNA_START=99 /DNA_END=533 /DNA_ORIENTATION=-